MSKVIIRPTIPTDLPAAIAEPLPCRIRAYTALLQAAESETVLGVGGIAFLPNGVEAFLQVAPQIERKHYAVSLHRGGLMLMRMLRAIGLREVVANCDADNPAAIRWLKRLGFVENPMQPLPGKIAYFWMNRD